MNGLCECGCGEKTSLAKANHTKNGRVRGQPIRYIFGHNRIGKPHSIESRKKMSISKIGNQNAKGMKHSEQAKKKMQTHGCYGTRTYSSWQAMRYRCSNPNNRNYKRYGGRGITVCDRWNDFVNFLADMGERPEGTSIDRINNDKGYYPDNCQWATPKQQANNRRNNI